VDTPGASECFDARREYGLIDGGAVETFDCAIARLRLSDETGNDDADGGTGT